MIAVATWIGGFDVLYALADRDFDRGAGLHSIPARFGVAGALVISAALHVVTVAARPVALAPSAALGVPYLLASPSSPRCWSTSTPSCARAICRASTSPSST